MKRHDDPARSNECISRTRGVCGGDPTIGGRRLKPIHIWDRLDFGESVKAIADDYELPRESVLLCKALLDMARAYVRRVDRRARAAGKPIPRTRWRG